LASNFFDKRKWTICQAVPVPVLQESQKTLITKLTSPSIEKRISTVMQVIGLKPENGERPGIKVVRALNFPAQIIASSLQPFLRVNIRVARFQVDNHLPMNNRRVDDKESLWEKDFNCLIVPPQMTFCESQYHQHRHRHTKESKLGPDAPLNGRY
jgi:hypothetical protein